MLATSKFLKNRRHRPNHVQQERLSQTGLFFLHAQFFQSIGRSWHVILYISLLVLSRLLSVCFCSESGLFCLSAPSSPVQNRRLLSARNARMSSIEMPDDNEKSVSSASTSPCHSPVSFLMILKTM